MSDLEVVPPVEPKRSVVRFNATKHGILSVSPVIPWVESEDDWYEFRDGIFNAIKPEDELQSALKDRAAGLFWRMMRAVRHERESVADNLRDIPHDMLLGARVSGDEAPEPGTPEHKRRVDTMAMARLLPDEPTLAYLNVYENRLQRHLNQTLRQIALLKKWAYVFEFQHGSGRDVSVQQFDDGLPRKGKRKRDEPKAR